MHLQLEAFFSLSVAVPPQSGAVYQLGTAQIAEKDHAGEQKRDQEDQQHLPQGFLRDVCHKLYLDSHDAVRQPYCREIHAETDCHDDAPQQTVVEDMKEIR